MNHLKRRSLCKSCRVCFVRDNDTQVYCHSCLETAKSPYKAYDEKRERKCLICKTGFIQRFGHAICSPECHQELRRQNNAKKREVKEKREAQEEGLTLEAKRWLNLKKRGTKAGVPFHELIKRMEYSRVFGKYSESPLYFKRKGFGK